MKDNLNPFKYLRLVNTLLRLLAFVAACMTIIWFKLPANNFSWNNRTLAIIALNGLGFPALYIITKLPKRDQPKTLIFIVIILASFITVIALAVEDYFRLRLGKEKPNLALVQPSAPTASQLTLSNATSQLNGSLSATDLDQSLRTNPAPPSSGASNSNGASDKLLTSNEVGQTNQDSRVWISPEEWVRVMGNQTTKTTNPPSAAEPANEQIFITKYEINQATDSHDWYVGNQWKVSNDSGLNFMTNIPPSKLVVGKYLHSPSPFLILAEGIVLSATNTNTYILAFPRPPPTPSGLRIVH